MRAPPPPRRLLIGKIDRSIRSARIRLRHRMAAARKACSRQLRVKRGYVNVIINSGVHCS